MMHHGSIARCSSVHSCISVIHVSIHFLCLQLQCVQEVNPQGGSYSEGGSSSSTLQVVNLEAETTPDGPPAKSLPTNSRPPPPACTVHTQPAATTVPPPAAPTVQPPPPQPAASTCQPPPAASTELPASTVHPPPADTTQPATNEADQSALPATNEAEQTHEAPPPLTPAQLALPDMLPIPPLLPLETITAGPDDTATQHPDGPADDTATQHPDDPDETATQHPGTPDETADTADQ